MKRTFALILAALLLIACAACAGTSPQMQGSDLTNGQEADGPSSETPQTGPQTGQESGQDGGENDPPQTSGEAEEVKLTITIGASTFRATLEQNEAARAFARLLPMTLEMTELNGNEKYHYLDGTLPAQSEQVQNIAAGDLMLYGSNCVVLFYESFPTTYRYTRLGKLDDVSGLAQALGRGSVTVTFAVTEA